jgi:uncharacterized RDD family membrane protein YckC
MAVAAILLRMQEPSESSALSSEPSTQTAEPAHLGWRLLAMVYDAFPLMALWFATSGLELLATGGKTSDRLGTLAGCGLLALLWAVTGAYLVISWRRGGATIGMRPWRLRVLAADGQPAPVRTLCLRYVVATLSLLAVGLGFIWALFDGERRCWHDIAAGTRFVRMDRTG